MNTEPNIPTEDDNMATAAVRKPTDEQLSDLDQAVRDAAPRTALNVVKTEEGAPNTLQLYTEQTCLALDKVTTAVMSDVQALVAELENVSAEVIESGNRAKAMVRAHLGISERAHDLKGQIEQHVSDMRADAAKLVSGA